jgi:hypothetical protein
MAFDQKGLDDYIDVAQRIADFRAQYPEGTLQPVLHEGANYRLLQAQGTEKNGDIVQQTFVVVVAAAFRSPTDPRPGIGMAWEVFPGRTNFTRGSELQNAETSAWGRAIIAVGASDSKKGIASREEVRNRQAEREDGLPANKDGSTSRSRVTDAQLEQTGQMTKEQMAAHNKLERDTKGTGPQGAERLTAADPDDPWQDQAAGQLPPPVFDLENEAGSSDSKQRMQIALKLERAGFATQEAARAECSRITGREIATRKDLSFTEAAAILAALDKEAASA